MTSRLILLSHYSRAPAPKGCRYGAQSPGPEPPRLRPPSAPELHAHARRQAKRRVAAGLKGVAGDSVVPAATRSTRGHAASQVPAAGAVPAAANRHHPIENRSAPPNRELSIRFAAPRLSPTSEGAHVTARPGRTRSPEVDGLQRLQASRRRHHCLNSSRPQLVAAARRRMIPANGRVSQARTGAATRGERPGFGCPLEARARDKGRVHRGHLGVWPYGFI